MNIYLFWILFLALWAIVPLMIIKGRVDEEPKMQTSPKVKAKKKGWFNWGNLLLCKNNLQDNSNLNLDILYSLKVKKLKNNFLYLVVLGGRAEKANIELNDVRWVVGSKIEDSFDTLRKDWFWSPKGLHIDSYKK